MATVDQKTPRLGLLLPYTDNFLQDDVQRLRETLNLLDVIVVERDQTTGKIADTELSAIIARLDAQGKLIKNQLPSSVVQTGSDGKIDASLMPSIAVVDTFVVPNEASMLGLQCERGDIAIREDVGNTFILTQMPPSTLSNWRVLTSTNVTSVNGKTGAVTGLAASGANRDITSLESLSGATRLGGDGIGDYDAVTVRQLRAAGGSGGASINGVMNNFIGAVQWFNGPRTKLPAGYIPADGQLVSRTDAETIDLWAAVNNGMYASVLIDGFWLDSGVASNPYVNRGKYSPGDGLTTFRVPDLNGFQNNSIAALFLRGSNNATDTYGRVGDIYPSRAPDIKGTITTIVNDFNYGVLADGTGAFAQPPQNKKRPNVTADSGANSAGGTADFAAGRYNPAYGRVGLDGSTPSGEVAPNWANGIWIIRASGQFKAQGTIFSVINGDSTIPAAGTTISGGLVISNYQVGTVTEGSATLKMLGKVGQAYTAQLSVYNKTRNQTANFDFSDAGDLNVPGTITMRGSYVNTAASVGLGLVTAADGPAATNSLTLPTGMYYGTGNVMGSPGGLTTQGLGLIQVTASNPSYRCQLATSDGNSGRLFIRSSTVISGSPAWTSAGWQEFQKVSTSDERLKHSIETGDARIALDNIDKMKFKNFVYNNDIRERLYRGLIAQDLEVIDPNYLQDRESEEEYRVLNTQTLLLDALAAIQVLSARVKDLESGK